MIDIMERLLRKIRPYEKNSGETQALFDRGIERITAALERGILGSIRAFKQVLKEFAGIAHANTPLRPKVFIVGEFLLNFHPGANFFIEDYLEKNGMEIVLPKILHVFHRNALLKKSQKNDQHVHMPFSEVLGSYIADVLFKYIEYTLETIACKILPFYKRSTPIEKIAAGVDNIMHRTFTSGEGWIIPGEILHNAQHGIKSFIILQPFGCLPNHICGRGVIKRLKELHPDIQILPLDYDPDISSANIENRLQMLIMNARELHKIEVHS